MEKNKKYNFVALLNGIETYACELDRKTHRGISFVCPYYGNYMWAVMGQKKIWHFRHVADVQCPRGGGESDLHVYVKNWFGLKAKEYGYEYHLEKTITDEKTHRPDVIIYLSEEQKKKCMCTGVAVEFQNSPMTESEYDERNFTYLENNLSPWWVFGGKHYKKIEDEI